MGKRREYRESQIDRRECAVRAGDRVEVIGWDAARGLVLCLTERGFTFYAAEDTLRPAS